MKRLYLLVTLLLYVGICPAQTVRRVLYPTITVSDLDRVLPFYTDVLPFQLLGIRTVQGPALTRLFALSSSNVSARIATLQLGVDTLELMDFTQPSTARPIPFDSRSNDGWFQHIAIVVRDMDQAYSQLRQRKVTHISTGPQTLPAYIPAAAGVRAFYFRDPDGHSLELISFPPGKGKPVWQLPGDPLFLGIDHTAIGSEDTDTSLAFYRDLLGLTVGGSSENYGPEQEHLNQVYGARLMISGLTTGAGLGIELLDYVAPPGGRPYPAQSRATDLWHWHTTLLVSRLDELLSRIKKQNYTLISPGIVPLDGLGIAARRGLLVRDPDGHALLLCE
ncbi:VOC family protein [Spirosoma linguale]|uniref:Glyoxalase/bleomycin resistance protein/dioxygenase n=1 Tax=Spirosoma linguale (strain ATCC 33905 / DSM 74 / LMG 10896 / Claus 1) TaxID=504472 RepID=D2QGM6_SPILD|nr:Glyoxalase/bleomycin resistance protein/dioxygenase [Spirosoma linguale DSM 74]